MSHTGIEPAVAPRIDRRITNEQSPSGFLSEASEVGSACGVSEDLFGEPDFRELEPARRLAQTLGRIANGGMINLQADCRSQPSSQYFSRDPRGNSLEWGSL